MKVQVVSIDKLKPNPNNPRVIRDEKFMKLVRSIEDFPEMLSQARPLVCNKDMEVLGGNMRLRACQEAGLKKVPVVVVEWTKKKQEEFIIKDNLGFGEWDWDKLANEWDAELLTEWGMDIPESMDIEESDLPSLADSDEPDYETMTFTLSKDQAVAVKHAMNISRGMGPFIDTGNANNNGNAISRICDHFIGLNQ